MCAEVLFGTRLRVFGSTEVLKEFSCGVPQEGWNVFMMNHRTRLDWYYIWITFLHCANPMRMAATFKIILKASLKKIPGFGTDCIRVLNCTFS